MSTHFELLWAICRTGSTKCNTEYSGLFFVLFFSLNVNTRQMVTSICTHLYRHATSITPFIFQTPCQWSHYRDRPTGMTESSPGCWLLLTPAVAPGAKWPSPKSNRHSRAIHGYFSEYLSSVSGIPLNISASFLLFCLTRFLHPPSLPPYIRSQEWTTA